AVRLAGSKTAEVLCRAATGACTKARQACRGTMVLLHGGWRRALALVGLALRVWEPGPGALGGGGARGGGRYPAGPAGARVVLCLASLLLTLATLALRSLGQLLNLGSNIVA